jgi:mannose-1-phosphate guanylyltransferase
LGTPTIKSPKPWGKYEVIFRNEVTWTKALTIYAGESLSLHYHEFRQELWFPLEAGLRGVINGSPALDLTVGHVYSVPQNVLHRIVNPTGQDLRLIEVATGTMDDADIIRVYDKYRS